MKRIALNALALLLVVAFVALGRWQLDRERHKRAQLAAAASALAADPAWLGQAMADEADDAAAGRAVVVRRVDGDAGFLGTPPLWLDNQRRGDRVGVRLYCLAELPGSAARLMVDLGWLPLPGDRRLPDAACPGGRQRVAGLLVPPPSPGLALGPAVVEQADGSLLATRLELAALRTAWRQPTLARPVLRLDPAIALGYERDLELLANTLPPEKHRGYAVQWFGLATALAILALIMNFRRKPQT